MIDKLSSFTYTRRAQAITWMPFMDNDVYDPPCLQSIWCRLSEDEGDLYLNTNIRFRSNDAWGAAYMNMFGLTLFVRSEIADPLQLRLGMEIKLGRINWQADSYHIYGKDLENFNSRFWKFYSENENLEDRAWGFRDPMIQEIWNESEKAIIDKIKKHDEDHNYVR
jgi:thymidylate synthase